MTGTPSDYADTLYRVYVEIADHEDFGKRVIERFLSTRGRDIPGLQFEADGLQRIADGYELHLPIQLVLELVRELGRENVAVHQIVRLGPVAVG
ncbi:hypothetical protein LU699_09940 [Luteimonas fraxinea]|uniref:hypothetical protein n=1 Tax=Luteimonas fraxinea TaxID=2901869 RepID=UPI001E4C12AE|nr:hypothetical protein [Luteimonas fraxinea]UHH08648.1 hypothetical protein LU699_09940 [Luteimonas fraxinea]